MSLTLFVDDTCPICRNSVMQSVIEPHPTRRDLALHKFECVDCGPVRTETIVLGPTARPVRALSRPRARQTFWQLISRTNVGSHPPGRPYLRSTNQMNEKLPAPCEACHGSGLRHGAVCGECQGKGYRLFVDGRQIPVQKQSPQRWRRPRPAQSPRHPRRVVAGVRRHVQG